MRAKTSLPPATDAVRFVRRGAIRTLRGIDPNMTVLEYLREVARDTGTKEGCAEGDCGACTVVVGELVGGRIRYRAVNACIQFLPTLDGKELVTVEDLRAPDGALHPVQEAMVECHGSQCGFCTPGFVMSLFALYKANPAPDRAAIDDALAGNLCRCTGYRPIVEAARRMYRRGAADAFATLEPETVALLASIRREQPLALEGAGRRYYAPTSLDELAAALSDHPGACLLAGGTDVGLWVTKEHRDLEVLIHTGEVSELKVLRQHDGHIEIGAAVTYSDAAATISAHYPSFGELVRRLGSVQIRNAGTIGGNVANGSPIGDSMPPLIALGASVLLRRGDSVRELPLDAFYTGYRETALEPGEFIVSLKLPVADAARAFRVYKVSKRFDQDISAVCGAFAVTLDGDRVREARICHGGMAAMPKRAPAAEAALAGRAWNEATARAAMVALDEDYQPLSDMRAGSAYRLLVARNLLYKFFLETTTEDRDIRVAAHGR